MADCNDLFREFLSEITVSSQQRQNLKTGKDAVRGKIETYFSDQLKVTKPSFYLQGSCALKTMVRPPGEEDYDLDDGVYLQHTDDNADSPTPRTVSQWIVDAVKGHVKKAPENKKNCVRVIYANGYHIDLPVYRTIKGQTYLGTLEGNQWIPSDPKAFNDWFHERLKQAEQMRSCIKYFKAWKDFSGCDLKGIHLTVLVAENFVSVEDRDDRSLAETVGNMVLNFKIARAVYNPVERSENLLKSWSDPKIDRAIEALEGFQEIATVAVAEEDKNVAAEKWQYLFGNRFPLPTANGDHSNSAIPPVVVISTPPKPWSSGWR